MDTRKNREAPAAAAGRRGATITDAADERRVSKLRTAATGPGGQALDGYPDARELDLESYDAIVLCLSGGKDSIACLLHLIDIGVDISRVELWHHDVDGREGSALMDWPFMRDYVRRFAEAYGLPLYGSWLEGGFEGELLKDDAYSRPHRIETPEGLEILERDHARATRGTRRRFPQVGADLRTRWCSSALKIDVSRRALVHQVRFEAARTLFITGERAQESANRARYAQLEPHVCDRRGGRKRRHVDAWRPILHWDEARVWDALERHRVSPPVPYRLGWSRSSCMTCIFNGPRIWATIRRYFPERLEPIVALEREFGTSISRRRIDVDVVAAGAEPLDIDDLGALEQARSSTYSLPIHLVPGAPWSAPPGAFATLSSGPS